ncbi:unnamed protein product [Bursaphelenchus okinawaensis]|uniref:7TM_GPCR_Srx domain-containing protein n=1 Tax=Bursaphelenchus okinawaensis TaxID=465554 RepID=A0A811KQJ1_9BILA|nr:unnamed protein product [Bursaphelenchus okinawaensis]CAG9110534.1 unnamed protein product [Bursaphelenchus okinawaensis]
MLLEFYFRYLMICKDYVMTKLHIAKFMFLSLCYTSWNASWSVYGCVQTMAKFSTKGVDILFENNTFWYEDGRPMTSIALYKEAPGSGVFLLCGTLLCIGSYSGVIYFIWAVYKHLSAHSDSMTTKTRKLQNNMNKVMLIQALIPLTNCSLPITVANIAIVMNVDFYLTGTIVITAFSWISVIKPMSTIYFVKPYRRRILSFRSKGDIAVSRTWHSYEDTSVAA